MNRIAAAVTLTLAGAACAPSSSGDEADAPPTPEARRHMPSDADRDAILGVVQSLFDALGERDVALLRDNLHPDILMHSVERSAAGERSRSSATLEQMAARLEAEGPRMTERMFEPEVRISGDLAMVWTPYDFYVGDDLSHCGADAFVLMREEDRWQIVSLSWTRLQPPECEVHPDGPPR